MATFSKRANLRQHRILRIVEGAVRNAADAHPAAGDWNRFARSVAKRAAGTLSAQWADVLAMPRVAPSDQGVELATDSMHLRRSHSSRPGERGRSQRVRPPPLSRLHRRIGFLAGQAQRAGQIERHAALVEVLRLVGAEIAKMGAPR